MFYYEVAVGGKSKGKQDFFTYEYAQKLSVGTVVSVMFKQDELLGFIVKNSSKPNFNTNSILSVSSLTVPQAQVVTYLSLCSLYPFSGQSLAHLFLPPQLPKNGEINLTKVQQKPLEDLNSEQASAVELITSKGSSAFLFGDTGTGKTRVYTHLIKHYLKQNKNVILLAPEIGLASYIYKEVQPYITNSLLYHSNLASKKRSEVWKRAHDSDKGLLLVGPRSALTLPLQNIGLIIMDESHDASYRQDNQPYIHSRAIAALLAKNYGGLCVYGTATPNVADFYNATRLGVPIAKMSHPAVGTGKTTSVVAVSYDDANERTPGSSLLKTTRELLERTFKTDGQVLILMNRRGTARYISCETCGHEERCKNCDHLLVYHHDIHSLMCHFCTRKYAVPSTCSECSAGTLTMRSFGTKAVENEISKLFPSVTIGRFDTDTPKKLHLSELAPAIKSGEIQCVIGTQMVAKGLDLPKLKTLVVLGSGFSSSGFAGEEREFQLLYQVIGRANRGHQDTNVVIQTYNTSDHLLQSASKRDYESFYSYELKQRKQFNYPPFCHMGVIHYARKSSISCQKAGTSLINKLRKQFKNIEFVGPLSDTHERRGPNYHWHILMKSKKRSDLVAIAHEIGTAWTCELDPIDTP
jgi:primosomal protein N' (replication factor Y)